MRLEKRNYAFFTLLMSLTVSAQIEVSKIERPSDSDKGLFYRLPQSHVVIDFVAKKTTFKAGEYAKYSEKLLGLSNISQTDSVSWELVNVVAYNYSTANPNESYILNSPKGIYPRLSFSNSGLLIGVNALDNQKNESPSLPDIQPPTVVKLFIKDGKSILGEDFLMAGSTPKMAEVAAKQIYTLRENRQDLLSGVLEQMPKEAEALKFLSNQLDEQESLLTALFTGNTQEELITFRYEIPSITKNDTTQVLARFSKHLGIVARENLAGEPIYLSTKVQLPSEVNAARENEKNRGIVYYLPSQITLNIQTGSKKWIEKQFNSTEYAIKAALPAQMFSNPKTIVRLLLHPETGAIAEIQNEPVVNSNSK